MSCERGCDVSLDNPYLADKEYFFVGGHYTNVKDNQITVSQMFVEYYAPRKDWRDVQSCT
jgi:hypothetical protein